MEVFSGPMVLDRMHSNDSRFLLEIFRDTIRPEN